MANFWQTLRGPFSAVSKPILQVNTRLKALKEIYKIYSLFRSQFLKANARLKALDKIYKIYKPVHLWNPIWKPRKTLMASVIRTKHTAPEKKPADRSNAARPGGSREEKVPKALCSENASNNCAESKDKRLWCEAKCSHPTDLSLICSASKKNRIATEDSNPN